MAFRGGRGGARGGRGGASAGPVVPWAYDPDIKPHYLSTELFPESEVPIQDTITKEERLIVHRFCEHREKVHNGPLYTVLAKKRGLEDPFEDAVTYSKRYKKQRRKVPKLDSRPYVLSLFPPELYTTLDPTYTATATNTQKTQRKRLIISSLNTNTMLNGDAGTEDEGGSESETDTKPKKGGLLNSLLNDEDDEVPVDDEDADEEGEEEAVEEDEFEDDMDGDYNAEMYFDDGEEEGDFGDDDGGGGDYY